MNFYYADLVIQLINNISNKDKIRKSIFLGSSKGGYASLYFGLKLKADIVISGAQQYHLGDYLYLKEHRNIYEYITGDRTNGSVEYLNNLLIDEIKNSKWQPKIYLHYSERENTFKNHIRFLVEDLKNNNYVFCSDVKDYLEHSEVAKYFPSYVLSILEENL